MPTRRPHNKSRHGCQQCKKNRTKCDEQRPSCSRCTRIGAKCSLLDPSSALIIISGSPAMLPPVDYGSDDRPITPPAEATAATTTTTTSTTSTLPPVSRGSNVATASSSFDETSFQVSNTERNRLRLMMHYNQSSCWKSISDLSLDTEEGRSIWRDHIPDLAWKHDHLFHALLSVSALHLALTSTDPVLQQEYKTMAIPYHGVSLRQFRADLSNVTAENSDALFATACITALYSFGIHLADVSQLNPLAKVRDVFTLIRGSKLVLESGLQWMQDGIWKPWFCTGFDAVPVELSDDIEEMIGKLTQRISTTISTSTQRGMYETAINLLRQSFQHASREPQTQMMLVLFPICVPLEYMQMVCIGEPLALSILANFSVIMYKLRHLPWIQHWGVQSVEAVHGVLPPEWHDCISWAMRQVKADPEIMQLPTPE